MTAKHMLLLYNFCNQTFNHSDRNLSVIRSNIMHKCMLKAEEENEILDIKWLCCQWCMNPLSAKSCQVALQPQKRPKRRLRSLLKKDIDSLNTFQAKFVQKIKSKPPLNTMVFKCKICSKTTPMPLRKPIVEPEKESDEVIIDKEIGKKKKKKKKDKYAGLNIAAVESVKNTCVNVNVKKPSSTKSTVVKSTKKLSTKEQIRMQRALQQTALPKKKSLLDVFLDKM